MSKKRQMFQIRQITKETFNKFKKVRRQQTQLYGQYQLYSKNGMKYIGKQLPSNYHLASSRCLEHSIFKFNLHNQTSIYLFPLYGQSVSNIFHNFNKEGQLGRWLDKCGSLENSLFEIIKKLLLLVENNVLKDVVVECLRIFNGQLQYCHYSWMTQSHNIVISSPSQIQNYYFSKEELQILKNNIKSKQQHFNFQFTPTIKSTIYRIFFMILHIGTSHLKERNYQYGQYCLHKQHLKLRLDYFCSHYNQKGLGELARMILQDQQEIAVAKILKICTQQTNSIHKSRKTLTLSSNVTLTRKKILTEHNENIQTPIKNEPDKLNTSNIFSKSSSKSYLEDSIDKKITKKKNNQNLAESRQYLSKSNTSKSKPNKNGLKIIKKEKRQSKTYTLNAHNSNFERKQLKLKQMLVQIGQSPKSSIKILKYFGIEEYLPINLYQERIVQTLQKIHIKSNWVKQIYQNGSIYFGQMFQNKKQGKGIYLFNSNDFYYGDWVDNFMNGYGTYIFISGEVYQGQLKKGNKDGHGRCIYADHRQYEGSWSKNCKIGLGKVKFPNEVIFIGIFKPLSNETQGLFIGPIGAQGKPLWQNKGILEHYQWQKNSFLDNINQQRQTHRKDNLQHCRPEFYTQFIDVNGNLYEGQSIQGKKQGYGILQCGQQVYKGEWKDDKRSGQGTLYNKNSFTLSGLWKNNVLVKYNYQEQQQYY